jgi:hypothetical protein
MARPKTGGRQKGTPNRRTAELQREVAKTGLTPLNYMLKVMRDDDAETDVRLDAAKSAAPYVHPKLASVEVGNRPGEAFIVHIDAKLAKL